MMVTLFKSMFTYRKIKSGEQMKPRDNIKYLLIKVTESKTLIHRHTKSYLYNILGLYNYYNWHID